MSEAAITEKVKYTSTDLGVRLREYLSGGEWVVQFEVGNSTGHKTNRHADAVAMSIWPSRGYKIHGYEIKVSRSDWQRELREPQKADAIGQYCDAWFLIAPPDIVHEVEVPETWGWLVPSGKSLRIKKQPKPLPPKPLGRDFIAAMLRNNHADDERRIAEKLRKLRAADQENNQKHIERELQARHRKYVDLKEAVDRFEKETGIQIVSPWGSDNKIGKKVKLVEAIGTDKWSRIPFIINHMRETLQHLEKAHQEFIGEEPLGE